jgi:hypothetical protein
MMGLNQREIPAALGQVSSSQNIESRLHRKSPEQYNQPHVRRREITPLGLVIGQSLH